MPRDAYEVLGLARDADEQQIKKAFRRLARELHPDVNSEDPEAAEKFKEAAEAYEILSDPERRATYDRYGHEGLRSGGYRPSSEAFGSLGDLFNAFFGEGGVFGGEAFGGARPARGGDIAIAVEIGLAEVLAGSTVSVSYEAISRCERCHGNGAEPGTPIVACPRCSGAGRLEAVARTPFGQVLQTVVCDRCHGEGRVARQPCAGCSGAGLRRTPQVLEVRIPPGIDDGQRIRVAGRGNAAAGGGAPGDLYVQVHVRGDERFVRDGRDLVTVVDVPVTLAALGGEVEVQTLEGATTLKLAPGTQAGEELRARGAGLPELGRSRRGDLRVFVNVLIPRHLSGEQRELLERLHATLSADNHAHGGESVLLRLRRLLRHHAD
ncbi:MAG TPA: molecular chaperone DnaJ [Solirubrobacteraceae bacterium]|nr:molecular chaperone DnaJ [Solirubrobacteraceae bacterium]